MIHTHIVQGIGINGEGVNVHVILQRVSVRSFPPPFEMYIYFLIIIIDYDGYSCMRQWDAFIGWRGRCQKTYMTRRTWNYQYPQVERDEASKISGSLLIYHGLLCYLFILFRYKHHCIRSYLDDSIFCLLGLSRTERSFAVYTSHVIYAQFKREQIHHLRCWTMWM